MSAARNRLFCFGLGYSARALAARLIVEGWSVAGTHRAGESVAAPGIEALAFDTERPLDEPGRALAGTTHLLTSVPPGDAGDPVLDHHAGDIAAIEGLRWIGYLSATSVYGDRGGAWVDESAVLSPTSARGQRRVAAEQAWLELGRDHGIPVHVFRLSGIYGPGRSVLDQVRAGAAKRIDKPGHLFSRIHVDDIARVLRASMAAPDAGAVYNVCDDEPASSADVTAHACQLLRVDPPPLVPFEEAARAFSPMARSFWTDNRRVSNAKMHAELGITLQYPSYREGLKAIADGG
jgi:nucleoside-diphosphate-sugar epimerase